MPPADLPVVVDNRLRLPLGIPKQLETALRRATTHANPDFHKRKAMGLSMWGAQSTISTWAQESDGSTSLPRGASKLLRETASEHGFHVRFVDKRVRLPAEEWPTPRIDLRWYQEEAITAAIRAEQGIIRAPTGSGKSVATLALAARVCQPALVIVRESALLQQWVDEAEEKFGLARSEVGILKGGKKHRVGRRLTLALQQTLYSKSFPLSDVARLFGFVACDEVQDAAATTVQRTIDAFPARYRFGVSADHTRRDKKEFLTADQFGSVIYEITREEVEADGSVTPVDVVLVPTTFEAEWYRTAPAGERDFTRLMAEMTVDEGRNAVLVRLVEALSRSEAPTLVFSHRVEHARWLSDVALFARRVRSGLLLGGAENAVRFDEDKRRLKTGEVPVCVGTYNAVGRGIDVPAVLSGVMATPIGANRQFFGQVRGRVCRPSAGKKAGTLYVLWDRLVLDAGPRLYGAWNSGRVRVEELEAVERRLAP